MQGAQQTLAVIFSTMCTIAILLEVVPGAPLVVVANRDVYRALFARLSFPPVRREHNALAAVLRSAGARDSFCDCYCSVDPFPETGSLNCFDWAHIDRKC